jgi:hypothetical protein
MTTATETVTKVRRIRVGITIADMPKNAMCVKSTKKLGIHGIKIHAVSVTLYNTFPLLYKAKIPHRGQ